MRSLSRLHQIAAASANLIATFLLCSLPLFAQYSTQPEQQEIPPALQPPVDEKLILQLHGNGDQIYSCKSESGQFYSRSPALRYQRTTIRQTFRRAHLAIG